MGLESEIVAVFAGATGRALRDGLDGMDLVVTKMS